MTEIKISKNGNSVVKVCAQGHSGYDETGKDIVCAAVSTLLQTALMGLLQVVGIDVKYSVSYKNSSLKFSLPKTLSPAERHDADIILDTMLCGICDLQNGYPEYINLKI